MKKLLSLAIVGLGLVSLFFGAKLVYATTHSGDIKDDGHQVTFCHATPPDTAAEGYTKLTSDKDSIFKDGHGNQHDADILPQFDYQVWEKTGTQLVCTPGYSEYGNATQCRKWHGGWNGYWEYQNKVSEDVFGWVTHTFNAKGDQSILANNCVVPPVDVCPNLDGNQATVPGGYHLEEGQCVPNQIVCDEGQHEVEGECVNDPILGCTDRSATNFDPEATEDDKSCTYPTQTITTTETPLTPAGAPICQDGNILALPIAFQVLREGDKATLTWYKTGGDKVNIYFKEVGQANWTHAVGDVPNVDPKNVFVVDHLVPSVGYIFAIEQHQGCAGGQLVQSVVVDGPVYKSVVFEFSYWQWSK